MADYMTMYFKLAGQVSRAVDILIAAQQQGEDMYVESEDTPITLLEVKADGSDRKDEVKK